MKWIGQHIWDLASRFRDDVYFEDLQGSSETTALVIDGDGKVTTNSLGAGGNGESELVRLEVRYGEAVSKGDPVYVSGYHGSVGPVIMSRADASNDTHMPAFGLADANYSTNATGYAISIGNLQDLNTSSYAVGDTLYVAAGGGLTNVKPTGTNYIQNVATVSRSNANNGQIEVVATGRSNDVPTPLYIDHNNQRLGIGTSSPLELFHIESTEPLIRFDDTNSGLHYIVGQDGDGFKFTTNNSTYAKYTFDSKVGIGTSSPEEKLSVSGSIQLTNQQELTWSDIGDGNTGRVAIRGNEDNDWIMFKTDNSERMRLTNTGLGIGTSSPSEKLHVSGNARIEGDLTVNGTYTQIDTDTNTTEQWLVTNDGTGPAAIINQKGSQDIFDVQDDGTSVFYIEDGGNVGIGTTSPESLLTIKGDALTTSQPVRITNSVQDTHTALFINNLGSTIGEKYGLQFGGYNQYSIGGIFGVLDSTSGSTSGDITIDFANGTSAGDLIEKVRFTHEGNVGIGTTSPSSILEVGNNSGSHAITINKSTTGTGTLYFDNDGNHKVYIQADSGENLRIGVNNAEKLCILESGNVGIGTTSPGAKFHINVDSEDNQPALLIEKVSDNNETALVVKHISSSNIRGIADFQNTSGSVMKILADGNVGIGTTSPTGLLSLNETPAASQAAPTLAFGDGDTGFYERFDDDIRVSIAGTGTWEFSDGAFGGVNAGNAILNNENATTTNPTVLPYRNDPNTGLGGSGADVLSLIAGGVNGLNVISSGNVGVGTTSPSEKLDVNGNLRIGDGGTGSSLNFNSTDRGTIKINGSEKMRIKSTGNVVIGSTADNGGKLQVEGDIRLSNSAKIFLWQDHDINYLKYDVWRASASAGMTIENVSSAGEIYLKSGNALALTLDDSQNATFEGSLNVNTSMSGGLPSVVIKDNGRSGSAALNYISLTDSLNATHAKIGYLSGLNTELTLENLIGNTSLVSSAQINIKSGGSQTLTLDSSQNATFAGELTVGSHVNMGDGDRIKLGDSDDLQIVHTGSSSYIHNVTDTDLYIKQSGVDRDVIFLADNGSGGETAYLTLDGGVGATYVYKDLKIQDSVYASFGTSNDFLIGHDGTNTRLYNYTGNMQFINYADDADIIFQNDDGSGGVETYFFLDGSASSGNPITIFPDNSILQLGTSTGYGDLQLLHNGTNSYIQNAFGQLYINQNVNDGDIVLQCDDGSGGTTAYLTLDGSAGHTTVQKEIQFLDSVIARFGNGNDMSIQHNGTDSLITNNTGDLYIQNTADDKDIIFQSDDGSGGNATYLTLDGGAGKIVASKPFQSSNVLQATPDKIGNITIQRESGSGAGNFDVDALGSYILSKTDGGFGVGTKPSGSHNGTGFISLQTHSGNYFTQLALSTNTNDLFIRSANNSSTFNFGYERLVKEDDVILATDIIKVLPHHFMSNEDGGANKSAQFRDDTIIGVRTSADSAELYAFVEIPYGKTARTVTVYGNDTSLVVNVYESDINAGALTDKTPGAGCVVGTECDITDVAYSATNYLVIKVTTVSYTNDIVYGAVVTIG